MNILITGADGFIGKHLTAHFSGLGHLVTGVDFKDGDLREHGMADYLIGKHRPEVVIHLAAQVGIYFNECDCVHAIESNAIMTLRVAQACRLAGASPDLIRLVDPPMKKTMVKRLSTAKLRALGWQPTVGLDDGMAIMYQWVKQFPWEE